MLRPTCMCGTRTRQTRAFRAAGASRGMPQTRAQHAHRVAKVHTLAVGQSAMRFAPGGNHS